MLMPNPAANLREKGGKALFAPEKKSCFRVSKKTVGLLLL